MKNAKLLHVLAQIFFVVACLAMFYRYGVKYDTGLGYREVILMLLGSTLLLIFFIKNIKLYCEFNLLFIIGILILISFLNADVKNYGMAEVLGYFAVANTIVIISQLNAKKIQILTWGLVLIGILAAVYGIATFALQDKIRLMSNFINPLDPKQGFPNAAALFMLIIWPYAALKIAEAKSLIPKIISFFALASLFAALYLTFSRGAYIALILQVIILGLLQYRKIIKHKYKWLAVIIITIFISSGTLYVRGIQDIETKDITEKLTFGNNEQITSVAERKDFFIITAGLVAQKPLLGYGPQSFRFVYPAKQEMLYANSDHPHNILLKTAFESGLPCALLLLILLVYLGIKCIRKPDIQKTFLTAAAAGGIAHSLIDYNFNFLLIYIVFAFTAGILINLATIQPQKQKKQNIPLIAKTFFIGFFALTVLLALTGLRDYFKTDPYSDFETIQRYTNEEIEKHILYYSESFYPREFWIQLSDYYFIKSDYDRALEMISVHISKNPYDKFGFLNRGRILYDLGAYNDAVLSFEAAIKLDSKNSLDVHYFYIKTLNKINKAPAQEYLDNLLYPILDRFMYYAEHNLHFVSMKPEIDYAYDIMEMLEKAGDTSKDWQKMKSELNVYKEKYKRPGTISL